MIHQMKLNKQPFSRIKSGKKTIEVRLFDEKRQKLRIGDQIEFSLIDNLSEKILVEIIGFSRFGNFKDFYSYHDYKKFGHPDGITLEQQVENARKFYSVERENKYGVLGIHIKLIK